VLCVDVIDSVPKVAYREVLGDVILHETNISSVSRASAVLVNLVRVASARDGGLGLLGGFLLSGVGLRMRCGWRFQTRSNRQTATMNFASMQFERIIFPTYREVLGDIGLHETDISSVTGASSLLVSLVLVARVCVRERRSRREARSWGERRGESNEGHEEEDNFGEHCISVWYRIEYGWRRVSIKFESYVISAFGIVAVGVPGFPIHMKLWACSRVVCFQFAVRCVVGCFFCFFVTILRTLNYSL
jgi:hypothetical protein